MPDEQPARQAPATQILPAEKNLVFPVGHIQGNIIPGFNKDFQALLFLAYQTSIEDQFEFVQKKANDPHFKEPRKGNEIVSGYDPIIGQNNRQGENRERKFRFTFEKDGTEQTKVVPLPTDWVIPTGGGYFFAPSIEVLDRLANDKL